MRKVLLSFALFLLLVFLLFFKLQESTKKEFEEIKFVRNEEYLDFLLDKLKSSRKSIKIVMFDIWFNFSDQKMNELKDLLAEKSKEIEIRAIVDDGSFLDDKEMNQRISVCKFLSSLGIKTKLDSDNYLTHAKFVLFDDECVLVGSTNWSWYSFNVNREANVFVCSSQISEEFKRFFDDIWKESRYCS